MTLTRTEQKLADLKQAIDSVELPAEQLVVFERLMDVLINIVGALDRVVVEVKHD